MGIEIGSTSMASAVLRSLCSPRVLMSLGSESTGGEMMIISFSLTVCRGPVNRENRRLLTQQVMILRLTVQVF